MTHSLRTAEPDESYSNSSPLKQDKIFNKIRDVHIQLSWNQYPRFANFASKLQLRNSFFLVSPRMFSSQLINLKGNNISVYSYIFR